MLNYARKIFNQQIRFARANLMREPGMTVKKAGESFAALYDVEYGDGVDEEDVQVAWHDIETALINLLEMTDLRRKLVNASHLIAQRPLTFSYEGVKAKMTPDLVAFFNDQPPLIVDWKVHTFGSHAYRLQLALYALALINCEPHSDFPNGYQRYAPTNLQLSEVQLLKKRQRHYRLTDADIDAVSNYMARSALDMELAVAPFDGELLIDDIPTPNNPDKCPRCPFRSLCWSQG
jgi:CRISPR/Cas system-associated exonuclease Cas4 (RecB family)